MTLVVGVEIKGARRWIALPGMSIQPSEFLKPCFAVVVRLADHPGPPPAGGFPAP